MSEGQVMLLEDGTLLHLVHFLYLSPQGITELRGQRLAVGPDTWKIACAPNLTEFNSGPGRPHPWRRSEDSRAVSCPLCKETSVYQEARSAMLDFLNTNKLPYKTF